MGMDTFMDLLRRNLSEKDFTRMMAFTAAMEPGRGLLDAQTPRPVGSGQLLQYRPPNLL
jgi:hypothetical protein